jgi:hypothetical protein
VAVLLAVLLAVMLAVMLAFRVSFFLMEIACEFIHQLGFADHVGFAFAQ